MNEFVLDPLARLFGEWSQSLNIYSFLLRIALAVFYGFIIGFERSSKRHSAGLRTFLLITLAGCAVGRLDIAIHDNLYLLSAAAVLGAVIVSGNSILFSSKKQIKGLTTSVALWLCLVLGLFAGFGFYLISLILFILLVDLFYGLRILFLFLSSLLFFHADLLYRLGISLYWNNFFYFIKQLDIKQQLHFLFHNQFHFKNIDIQSQIGIYTFVK